MPAKRRQLAMASLALMVGLAGCHTPEKSRPTAEAECFFPTAPAEDAQLAPENEILAKSLAEFSTGLIRETNRDDASVSNYAASAATISNVLLPHLRLAAALLRNNDPEGAMQALHKASINNTNALALKFFLAELALANNENDIAKTTIDEIKLQNPNDTQAHLKLASLLFEHDREKEAVALLETALPKLKNRLPVLRLLGDYFAQQAGSKNALQPSNSLARALTYYNLAAKEPQDEQSLVYMERIGNMNLMLHNYTEAVSCFEAIALARPDVSENWNRLAYCYIALGQRDKAFANLKRSTSDDEKNAPLLTTLGEIFESLDDLANAEQSYLDAIEADRHDPKPAMKLAALLCQFDCDAALSTLETAFADNPDNLELIIKLASMHMECGNPKKAIALYLDLQNTDFSSADHGLLLYFHMLLASIATQEGEEELAKTTLEKALATDPDSLETYSLCAAILLHYNIEDEAIALMRRAALHFKTTHDEPAALIAFGTILNRPGHYEEALAVFRKAESLVDDRSLNADNLFNANFYFIYGAVCERLGLFDEAVKLMEHTIEMNPTHADALNYLAYMFAEKGINLNEAQELVLRALEKDPENGAYIDTLGWIYFQKGRINAAVVTLTLAHEYMPEDPTILDHLGDAYAELGDYENAIEAWTSSLKRATTNDAIRSKLLEVGIEPPPPTPAELQ